ncbi:MAG: Bacterial membrane flanked domain protein [Syntrophorhabdaceae bacterium PtaU1.Bin034]|jgi:membrane protein YdbS with pleckstrin-like domain|nr:MAG: Bacterial membrane flanked domain protein [Syntrophorhabdaceae bacterium PtaU1.Bin034]
MRTKLQPGESVALIVRKHWLVLLKPALFLLAVLLYLPFRHVKILGFEALLNYLLPYALALSGALFLYCYLDRRVSIWAVTSHRLVDEFGIVTHKSRENPLDKINDIVVEQTILGRIFGYGSISVQTAATAGETIIEFVEKPQELKQTINAQKAMRAERRETPDFPEGDRQRHGKSFQTVLLHESVRPPFSLHCPHCGREIAIDYAGRLRVEDGGGATESVEDRYGRAEYNTSVVLPSEGGDHQPSTTEGIGSAATGAKAAADPFCWKKRSR